MCDQFSDRVSVDKLHVFAADVDSWESDFFDGVNSWDLIRSSISFALVTFGGSGLLLGILCNGTLQQRLPILAVGFHFCFHYFSFSPFGGGGSEEEDASTTKEQKAPLFTW